jgi:hypothetical protein
MTISPQDFLALCEALRGAGACEVSADGYRAVWPTQAAAPGLNVVRVPVGKPAAEPKPPEPTYEAYEGEKPPAEVIAARKQREGIRKLMEGA